MRRKIRRRRRKTVWRASTLRAVLRILDDFMAATRSAISSGTLEDHDALAAAHLKVRRAWRRLDKRNRSS